MKIGVVYVDCKTNLGVPLRFRGTLRPSRKMITTSLLGPSQSDTNMALMAESQAPKYTLDDILVDLATVERLDSAFIRDSNRNARIQQRKYGVPECSVIIPDWLYLGDKNDCSDHSFLQETGITHILNVTDVIPVYFPDDFVYAQIKVDDAPKYALNEYFDAATAFIDTVNPKMNEENSDHHLKLLVHCAVGRSRSATIIIQYLMRRGVNVQNHPFVDRILSFGMMDTFIEDGTLYQRSLNCNGCCLCWIRCCISMSCCCCDGGSDDSGGSTVPFCAMSACTF